MSRTLNRRRDCSRLAVLQEFTAYRDRVLADGGIMRNADMAKAAIKYLKSSARLDNLRLAVLPDGGVLTRDSSPYKYASKLYSFDRVPNNVAQGTAGSQPYLSGFIAPNEKYAILNPNGGSKFMSHNTISFGASEPWSVTAILNWNGNTAVNTVVLGDITSTRYIYLRVSSNNRVYCLLNGGYLFAANITNQIIGKNAIAHVVADGLGGLKLYINAVEYIPSSLGTDTRFSISRDNVQDYFGKHIFRAVEATALSAAQCLADYNFWRSHIPEIETVLIGSKYVASSNLDIVTTANGTAIADATLTATWITGASGWCYHTSSVGLQGKIYNRAARNAVIANPPAGYHVATEAELTALAALGGNALKCAGSLFWTTANGTNTSGFTALGGASRNADGTFNTFNESVKIWCADSDKALQLEHNNDNAILVAMTANEGAYIRLIKD